MTRRSVTIAPALLLLLTVPLLGGWSWGLSWWKTRQGNRLYAQAQRLEHEMKQNAAVRMFMDALHQYRDALLDDPTAAGIHLDIGDVDYRQRKLDDAVKEYEKVLDSDDAALQAKAHYNIGNCQFRQGKYVDAIQSYKRVLELNPNDRDAKYNLEVARQRLKDAMNRQQNNKQNKQNQQQQQQSQQKKNQQAQQKNAKSSQQQTTPQNQQQQKQAAARKAKEQQGKAGKAKPRSGRQTAGAKAARMSKQEAEQLLQSLENENEKMSQRPPVSIPDNPDYHGKDY